ncbi:hypothetical protein HYW21_04345 [Candidatus Woesearchaeota archaeon]|nr:hypothetical protein [Candidatus Woesearchaeota archaeon]
MEKRTQVLFRHFLGAMVALFLVLFVYLKVRYNDASSSFILVLILSSAFLMLGLLLFHLRYQYYVGMTFMVFGIILVSNTLLFSIISRSFDLFMAAELTIGILLLVDGRNLSAGNPCVFSIQCL